MGYLPIKRKLVSLRCFFIVLDLRLTEDWSTAVLLFLYPSVKAVTSSVFFDCLLLRYGADFSSWGVKTKKACCHSKPILLFVLDLNQGPSD